MTLSQVLWACPLCRKSIQGGQDFCPACEKAFAQALGPRFLPPDLLAESLPLLAAAPYEGAWAHFIRRYKRLGFHGLEKLFAGRLRQHVEHWAPELQSLRAQAVVAIPSRPRRLLTETPLSQHLAFECARALKIPLVPGLLHFGFYSWLESGWARKLLKRQERLASQPGRRLYGRKERWLELRNLFRSRRPRLLLVDDVCTTGSTLLEAASLLEAWDTQVVGAFVLARRERWLSLP